MFFCNVLLFLAASGTEFEVRVTCQEVRAELSAGPGATRTAYLISPTNERRSIRTSFNHFTR
jgi:hypothetical protein